MQRNAGLVPAFLFAVLGRDSAMRSRWPLLRASKYLEVSLAP